MRGGLYLVTRFVYQGGMEDSYRSETLSALLRQARADSGITQRQLADQVGLSQATIQRHMTGGSIPRKALDAYVRVFHLHAADVAAALYPSPADEDYFRAESAILNNDSLSEKQQQEAVAELRRQTGRVERRRGERRANG